MIDTRFDGKLFVSTNYAPEYVERAHKATLGNESEIRASESCKCYYCGHVFNVQDTPDLIWIDERPPRERTVRCPMCGIDCVIGDASGFPIHDPEFIRICTETWFNCISRISDGKPVERVSWIDLLVD